MKQLETDYNWPQRWSWIDNKNNLPDIGEIVCLVDMDGTFWAEHEVIRIEYLGNGYVVLMSQIGDFEYA